MKSVLMSVQPYWVFFIIAQKMGWKIGEEKTVEVRKNCPKDKSWDKCVKIYCTKDKKSFARIPKEYQPLMEKFLGKVIGEFVCDEITYLGNVSTDPWCALMGDVHEWHKKLVTKYACLTEEELLKYGGKYAWHISNLVIYDKPRELSEFCTIDKEAVQNCKYRFQTYHQFTDTGYIKNGFACDYKDDWCTKCKTKPLKRPPQSWCYVESEVITNEQI